RAARLEGGLPADAGPARGPRAAAVGRDQGIAGEDAHVLHRHPDGARDHLRDHGVRALPLLRHPGEAGGLARWLELDGAAVLRRDARAAHPVEGGTGRGQLDEGAEAEAAVDAPGAQSVALRAQAAVVGDPQELVERLLVREALEEVARLRGVRI